MSTSDKSVEKMTAKYTRELFEKLKDDSIYEDGKEWLTRLIREVSK